MKRMIPSMILLLSAGSLAAEDLSYWDLRIGLGSYPGVKDAKYTYDDGSAGNDDKWDTTGGGVDIYASHRFDSESQHGGYIQFGLFSRASSGKSKTDSLSKIEHSAFGALVGGGYSYVAGSVYSLELGPRLGLGGSVVTEKGPGYKLESDSGGYASIDLSVNNNFNITKNFQLSAAIGVASWSSKNSFQAKDFGSVGYFPGGDAEYSGSGGYITIGAGIRL